MLLITPTGAKVEFTQGDDVTIQLVAVDDSSNPVDLTDADLATQILGANGSGVVTFPNDQHTIADQTTNKGQFALALGNAGADTASCGEGPSKQIITQVDIDNEVTYFRGNNLLTVYPATPQQ